MADTSANVTESDDLTKYCRICYETTTPLLQPCDCKGSVEHIHAECLSKWFHTHPDIDVKCELCHFYYMISYEYDFEYTFDIYDTDYFIHICPIYTALFTHFLLTFYTPLFFTPVDYDYYLAHIYTPIHYCLFAFYTGLFLKKARIQNWKLYIKYVISYNYIYFVLLYIGCIVSIPYRGPYPCIIANIIHPFFYYMHNKIAREINANNNIVFHNNILKS